MTHRRLGRIADNLPPMFSNARSWIIFFVFVIKFHSNLFPMVPLKISNIASVYGFSTNVPKLATNYLNQWRLRFLTAYDVPGHTELTLGDDIVNNELLFWESSLTWIFFINHNKTHANECSKAALVVMIIICIYRKLSSLWSQFIDSTTSRSLTNSIITSFLLHQTLNKGYYKKYVESLTYCVRWYKMERITKMHLWIWFYKVLGTKRAIHREET